MYHSATRLRISQNSPLIGSSDNKKSDLKYMYATEPCRVLTTLHISSYKILVVPWSSLPNPIPPNRALSFPSLPYFFAIPSPKIIYHLPENLSLALHLFLCGRSTVSFWDDQWDHRLPGIWWISSPIWKKKIHQLIPKKTSKDIKSIPKKISHSSFPIPILD